MVMPNKSSNQISKSTNNLNHLNYENTSLPPPPPPFVLDSSNNPAHSVYTSQPSGLTTSASSNRINPSATASVSGAEKPTKPSTFSMLTKGFKHIFSTDGKCKDKEFNRENGNYQSGRLGTEASKNPSAPAEGASNQEENRGAVSLDRSNSSSHSKSINSMNDYAIYDEAPPSRPDRNNSVAAATTPSTPASIISNNGGWATQTSVYGQQVSHTSARGLPHSLTTPALPNHIPSEPSMNRPTAPPMNAANSIENDELNDEIERLIDFTTNEERLNLQKKGFNVLASQIEAKRARIVSMEADIVELRHMFGQYRSPDDIDRLKHEIRELTNEKAQLELRISQNVSWTCEKCTVVNRSDSVVCEMCGTEKDGGEIIICEKCNEKNPLYKTRCKKCSALLLQDPNSSNENAGPREAYNNNSARGQNAATGGQYIRPTRPAPPVPPAVAPRRTASNTSNSSVPHTPVTPGSTPSPLTQNMHPYMFSGQHPSIPHVPSSASPSYTHGNQNPYFSRTPPGYNPNSSSSGAIAPPQPAVTPQPSPRSHNPPQTGNNGFTRI